MECFTEERFQLGPRVALDVTEVDVDLSGAWFEVLEAQPLGWERVGSCRVGLGRQDG